MPCVLNAREVGEHLKILVKIEEFKYHLSNL